MVVYHRAWRDSVCLPGNHQFIVLYNGENAFISLVSQPGDSLGDDEIKAYVESVDLSALDKIGHINLRRHKPAPIAANCWTTTKGGTEVPPLVVTDLRWITAWFWMSVRLPVFLPVEEHAKHPHSPYLFVSPKTGTMFDPDSFRHTHEKILKAIGAEHIRFHDLRHTFATLSLKYGVDVKTLSGALGHYDAGFTLSTYTHATEG